MSGGGVLADIGSHRLDWLLFLFGEIDFPTGKRDNLAPFEGRIEVFEGDLRSYHIGREAVEGPDYILHQGALPSAPRSIKDPITTHEVNVGGHA